MMRPHAIVALLSLTAVLFLADPGSPARAAPDQALGVAMLSATVAGNGVLLSDESSGALSSTKVGTGAYDVLFVRSIADCIPLTTNNSSTFVGTAGTVGDDTGFRVETRIRANNALADLPFNIVVFCPR